MPFASEKQRRYMWANLPEVATKWTREYGAKVQTPRKKRAKKSLTGVLKTWKDGK